MKTWKVGLIGAGFWSEMHLKAWKRIQGVELEAICDRNKQNLAQRAEQFQVPSEKCYISIDDLLDRNDCDIIDIVTPPETHMELVEKAASAGKHVICQKPFAPSLEQAEKMIRAAASAGIRLMVTENWRWLNRFQTIKSILNENRIGGLHAARYIHTDFYTPRMKPGVDLPQPFFRDMPKLLFYEMGAHWFDTWRFLFGTPRRLFAETHRVSPYVKGEDSGIIVLGYEDFYGYMDMSWATRQKLDLDLGENVAPVHLEQLVVDGERGTIKLYTSGKITIVSQNGETEETVLAGGEMDHEESHFRLQSHFIQCLNEGTPFQTSGEDNLRTLRMVFGVYESAANHIPVQLL